MLKHVQNQKNKSLKIGGGILLVIAFFFFYRNYCPIEHILGYPCPGCNMTTALYYLVQGKIDTALYFHPLVIILVITVGIEGILYWKYRNFSNRYSKIVLTIFLVLLIGVYIYRMISVYPNYPMKYYPDNYIEKIKSLFI